MDNWPGSLIPAMCLTSGDCSLCDMLTVFMNAMRWIFMLGGGGALLMIIWGAIQWAKSAGNTEKIEEGKNIILASVTGIIIILLAWQLVYILIATLTGTPLTKYETIVNAFYAPPCARAPARPL